MEKQAVQKINEIRSSLPQGVELVAVSKYHPAEVIQAIYEGSRQRIFAESHAQELQQKHEALPKDIQWHFIGHLQRNKVKQVVGKAALIQSAGSVELLDEIEKQAEKLDIVQDILLEVNIGGEAAKSGFAPEAVEAAAAHAKELAHVRVRGLMTIPPAGAARDENMVYFEKVHALYVDINRKMYNNGLDYLSMGMSGDFADAIRAGSNMVRVGTAIFGARDYTK